MEHRSYHVSALHPYHIPGMVTRTSTRWFRHWNSKRATYAVPFVTDVGKLSTLELVTWSCHPEQLLASTTSTVYTRLLKIWRKRKNRKVKAADRQQLLQVAALYVVNKSDYFMDRALAVLHRRGPLKGVVSYFVRKLDDKFWFVYRQVCYQTYWLVLRSRLNGSRDKSSKKCLKDFLPKSAKDFKYDVVQSAFETAADFWNQPKFRKTLYVQESKLRDRIKDPVVLAFFEDWSEPELD